MAKPDQKPGLIQCDVPSKVIKGAKIDVRRTRDGHGDCPQLNEAGECEILHRVKEDPNCVHGLRRKTEVPATMDGLRAMHARLRGGRPAEAVRGAMRPIIEQFVEKQDPKSPIGEVAKITGLNEAQVRYLADKRNATDKAPGRMRLFGRRQIENLVESALEEGVKPRPRRQGGKK